MADIQLTYAPGVNPEQFDGPYMLTVESASSGTLFFGPFRTYERAGKMATRIGRIVGECWSIEALQPGSFAPEWARIIAEDEQTNGQAR